MSVFDYISKDARIMTQYASQDAKFSKMMYEAQEKFKNSKPKDSTTAEELIKSYLRAIIEKLNQPFTNRMPFIFKREEYSWNSYSPQSKSILVELSSMFHNDYQRWMSALRITLLAKDELKSSISNKIVEMEESQYVITLSTTGFLVKKKCVVQVTSDNGQLIKLTLPEETIETTEPNFMIHLEKTPEVLTESQQETLKSQIAKAKSEITEAEKQKALDENYAEYKKFCREREQREENSVKSYYAEDRRRWDDIHQQYGYRCADDGLGPCGDCGYCRAVREPVRRRDPVDYAREKAQFTSWENQNYAKYLIRRAEILYGESGKEGMRSTIKRLLLANIRLGDCIAVNFTDDYEIYVKEHEDYVNERLH